MVELQRVDSLYNQVAECIERGDMHRVLMDPASEVASEYARLSRIAQLGSGESAAMAYARFNGGTVGSNNLRDVRQYCVNYEVPFLSVRAIVFDAVDGRHLLTEAEAEQFWAAMRQSGRKLPNDTAREALDYYRFGRGSTLTKFKD